jgi:hypothetical protein
MKLLPSGGIGRRNLGTCVVQIHTLAINRGRRRLFKNIKKGDLFNYCLVFMSCISAVRKFFWNAKFCSHYSEKTADKLFDYIKKTTELSVVLDL